MRSALTAIGFILVAVVFYILWTNLSARIIAIESDTGSYIYSESDSAEVIDRSVQGPDMGALNARLANLEALQKQNADAIKSLSERLDRFEAANCRGDDCGRRMLIRETVLFALNDSTLSEQAKDRINRLMEGVKEGALISLRGQADAVGDETYNYLLSLRRAAAVKQYLDTLLAELGQTGDLLITIDGTGEALSGGSDESENPARRMVEILIFE
ncbi:outer membrane protein OmpA-like peptidoglycan-associated protein [Marinobacter sp. 3-2]|jgi:outer membrane protein OmpA-like peptidoglycan-associated protein|uniref:OmpA family protein n=1 Tax=Marinobacter sp. 3-2 TaxID=2485141 RepID=UPI000D3801FB|nr:OmpA family protein [Marinobacter sp. 3-2]ROQ47413.1 outer membrane protein OmpA-like peptidoglycan-associated protein [Marinobacter sp. 3-2]